MGTKADFYVGAGTDAEWIGSISYDGYPDGAPIGALAAVSEASFRRAVEDLLADPDVLSTRPEEGWPWPWEDSSTTDYAYAWIGESAVQLSGPYPDMSGLQMDRGLMDSKRGGLILVVP